MFKSTGTPIERFYRFITVAQNNCWEWQGQKASRGYGYFWDGKRQVYAHRFAYEYYKGNILIDLEVDHLCRNHACVNPDHLELVTHQENCQRGLIGINQRVKTHCPHGHPYTEANIYHYKGGRFCRACSRLRYSPLYGRSKKPWTITLLEKINEDGTEAQSRTTFPTTES